MNKEINKLYIENLKLKDHLKGGEARQSRELVLHSHTPPKPIDVGVDTKNYITKRRKYGKEIAKLRKVNEGNELKMSQETLFVFEKILAHKVKYVMDKIDDVYT